MAANYCNFMILLFVYTLFLDHEMSCAVTCSHLYVLGCLIFVDVFVKPCFGKLFFFSKHKRLSVGILGSTGVAELPAGGATGKNSIDPQRI